MTTKEIKTELIENIEDIQDDELLGILKTVIDNYNGKPIRISEDRKKILDEAKEQIKRGDYFTDEEINKQEDQWLKD